MEQNRQVRVFISSTFRDMHAERDHLVTVVFPELRERVEQLGLEFFDVDLRWGVPAKDANGETANSWEYCRQWIDRVEPFFVCILGQRYGWVPKPGQLKATEEKQRQQDENRSITDMEVHHAVLNTKLKRRSYFYLRATDAPATASEYVDPPLLLSKLEQLKNEVRSCRRPVRDYPCEWTGSGFAGMEEFGRQVLDDLWSGVLRDERYLSKDVWRQVLGKDPDTDPLYTDESHPLPEDIAAKIVKLAKPEPKEPLDAEREQMDAFATSRLRWFQGRARELQQLTDFLNSTAADAPHLAVVAAVPGQGKSALLAHLHEQLKSSPNFIITHFVGATEGSASAHALVERLLGELDRSGITWPAEQQQERQEPKRDFNSMCLRLAQRLGDYSGERRIVVILDALNQLSDGHNLRWLPVQLGPNVRLIVSCVEDLAAKADSPGQRVLYALASRQPAPLRVPIPPLTEEDVRTIVVAYLEEYCHELDREHLDTLCAITQARNPLYLLVMLNELRTLGGNDLNRIVPARIASMLQDHPDTVSLFRWVLQRLEVFGSEAIRWWCLYLAHGRVGMASHELADLLVRKLGADAAATALRIERGLRRYLQRRGPQLDFFHSQLRQAVVQRYGPQTETDNVHSDIATYFHEQDNFLESLEEQRARAHRLPPTARPANKRKVEELFYQRLNALRTTPKATRKFHDACEALENLLADLSFLEVKTEVGLVFALAGDFSAAVITIPESRPRYRILQLLEEALRRDIHFIANHPTTLFQCLWNTCWWYDCPQVAQHYEQAEAGWPAEGPPWERPGPRLYSLLEDWKALKEATGTLGAWLRCHRPPTIGLNSSQRLVLLGHDGRVKALAFSPDGRHIASGSDDQTIRLWDFHTGEQIRCFRGHSDWVTSVAFSPDSTRLFSGSEDGTIRKWDVQTGIQLFSLSVDCGARSVACSPCGRFICVGGCNDNFVMVLDTSNGCESKRLRGHEGGILCVAFSPNGQFIASGSTDNTLRLWNTRMWSQAGCLRGHDKPVMSLAFSPDTLKIVSCARGRNLFEVGEGTLRLWDVVKGIEIRRFGGHVGDVHAVAYSPDGSQIISGGFDQTVRIWDGDSGEMLRCLKGHQLPIWCVSYSSDNRQIASGSGIMHNKMGDCSVRVWYSKCEGLFHALRDDRHGRLTTPVFSPDGNCVATGEMGPIVNHVSPSAVHLWDANKGILLRSFVGHEDFIMSAAFSPDSRRIVSGSNDQTVRVWNVADGSEVLRLSIDEWVLKVSFSADGKRIAARSISGRHHEWECESGQKLGVVPQVDDQRTDEHGLGSGALNTAFAYDASGARFQLVVTASETTIEDPSCGLPVAWFSCKWDGVAGSLQHHIWAGAEQTHLYLMTLERTSLTERNTYG